MDQHMKMVIGEQNIWTNIRKWLLENKIYGQT
jgi:hypothetical protein